MSNFTEEELQDLLKKDSKSLCCIIIINRTLGCYKKESKQWMIELMKRRQSGEDFKFEQYIKENIEKHNIKLNIPNIKSIKKNFISGIVSEFIKGEIFNVDDNDDLFED